MENNAEGECLHAFSLAKSLRSPEIKGSTYKPMSGASKTNNRGQTQHRQTGSPLHL